VLYFDVQLAGQAEAIQCKVYSKAMTMVMMRRPAGPFQAGWNKVAVPLNGQSLPSGLYYVVVVSGRGDLSQAGGGKLGRFVYLQ
jgi:hypothetical protein